MNNHWDDCNCIDCLLSGKGSGLGQSSSMPPAPMPGVDPATGLPLQPGQMPGMLMPGMTPPPVMPSSPSPASSSLPPPPPPPAPILPGMPGYVASAPAGMPSLPDPLANLNEGRTAFQQLTAKHSVFRTPVLAPHFPDEQSLEMWYSSNADDLKKLAEIALPLSVDQITDMLSWLSQVEARHTYSPGEMVELIEKLILGQNVSFPEIEIPARVIRFLKTTLRITVTGAQEKDLQTMRAKVRSLEYKAMDGVFKAQAALQLAQQETNVSNWQDNVNIAQSALTTAQGVLQYYKDDIASLNDQLATLQASVLTDDQLVHFLLVNLPDSPAKRKLDQAYDRIHFIISQSKALIDPIVAEENQVLIARDPAFKANQDAMAAFVAARGPINYANNTHQSPTQDQLDAYNQAQTNLAATQAALQPYTDQLTNLGNQVQAVIQAHPEFFPQGKPVTDPDFITQMLTDAVYDVATNYPSDLMSVVENAMAMKAQDTDNRIAEMQAERQDAINAKQQEFSNFFQATVEAKLKFYSDQMNAAQDGYNELNGELTALADGVQKLQDQLTANINALSSVIGWWCHVNNIPDTVMDQSYFIGAALESVVSLQGRYDVVSIEGVRQVFWDPKQGPSSGLAGETITLMGTMDTASLNYQMKAPALADQLHKMQDWMTQCQQAYNMTVDLVNSDAFMQDMVRQFASTPEGALLQGDIDSVVVPMRELTIETQADQQTMNALLDDIEVQALKNEGVDIQKLGQLPYEKKKALWVGVCDHLKQKGSRITELQGYIQAMAQRIQAGTPQDGDGDNMVVAKIALMNIIGAQLIQRQLQKDSDFQSQMQDEAHQDGQSAVNPAPVSSDLPSANSIIGATP